MSYFSFGTPSISSTAVNATNPSTSSIIAEIDSTQLGNEVVTNGGQNFQVTWILSASTNAIFRCEQCLSTGVDFSTSGRDMFIARVPINQSAQYITKHRIERGDRLRVRVDTAISAGVVEAKIQAEPLG